MQTVGRRPADLKRQRRKPDVDLTYTVEQPQRGLRSFPIAGAFMGGVNTQNQSLVVKFNPAGVVTFVESSFGVVLLDTGCNRWTRKPRRRESRSSRCRQLRLRCFDIVSAGPCAPHIWFRVHPPRVGAVRVDPHRPFSSPLDHMRQDAEPQGGRQAAKPALTL